MMMMTMRHADTMQTCRFQKPDDASKAKAGGTVAAKIGTNRPVTALMQSLHVGAPRS